MSHFRPDMKTNSIQLHIFYYVVFYYVVLGFDCFTSNNVYALSNHSFHLPSIVVGRRVPSMEHTFGLNCLEQ